MNISLLSLVSSALISTSSPFVGNYISAKNCRFAKFTTLLFFNQQSLLLYRSNFRQGISGVVKIQNEYSIETIVSDPIYGDYKINNYKNENILERKIFRDPGKESFKFIECTFSNIDSKNEAVLTVSGQQASLYLSDDSFLSCKSTENGNMIQLSSRCNTITHICSIDNSFKEKAEFLHVDAKENDFILLTYSTIVGGKKETPAYFIYAQFGHQYHRCLNLSRVNWIDGNRPVIQAQAPRCISISQITFHDINRPIIIFSGSIKDATQSNNDKGNITIDCNMINAYSSMVSDFFRFELSTGDCVFFSLSKAHISPDPSVGNKALFLFENDAGDGYKNLNFYITLTDCVFSNNVVYKNGIKDPKTFNVHEENVVKQDSISGVEIAHYTNDNCPGIGHPNKPTLAYGCNVDDCFAEEHCNATLGFPADVAPYETIIHKGLQSDTFTPTEVFSYTSQFSPSTLFSDSTFFSKSEQFSSSFHFSHSNFFSSTADFSHSTAFTQSTSFSDSSYFSYSSDFTKSTFFSNSDEFSQSNKFTSTGAFSKSGVFSMTNNFTKSSVFSTSNYFSNSACFTKTDGFDKTSEFTKTVGFSETTDFTRSSYFTETTKFSQSSDFTKSTMFSESVDFSPSKYFSSSKRFSGTDCFSKTDGFTETTGFSGTGVFSKSQYFSASLNFEPTENLNRSHAFTPSSKFSETLGFSCSDKFTKSKYFTESNYFTKSNYFTESAYFSETNEFTKSHLFSESSDFSQSDNFALFILTPSNHFTMTQTFIEKSVVLIDIKEDKSKSLSTGIKAGIGVACGAVGLAAIIIGIFMLLRRRPTKVDDFGEETAEIHEDTMNSIVAHNPLNSLLSTDDPFEDEFI